ncbi:MAG TPA: CaiB/BaiF CoA-transferase family protein [Vicinamibacterales bacterium]|nr:CaiB/BaiF CoA-transferase family protein [Vicinamibacterales bacterium]
MALPLAGVTVVSLEQAVAAPFATRQLADLGARVIKIERPGTGDFARGYDRTVKGLSSYFVWLNRSKESVTLDLTRLEARRVLADLLDRADVFVQNLAPGAAERLGVGAAALRARRPRLIACSISGYGSTGPFRDRKAYDLLVQGETGLVSITGDAESPAKVGISIADIAAGMYAYSGILTALLQRERTGAGAHVDVSLFDALGEWMSQPAYVAEYSGRAPGRHGVRHASIAPYGAFASADGTPVLLGIQNEREWTRFCADVLGTPDLARDPRFASNPDRVANRDALEAIVETALRTLTAAAMVERLERAGIACARLNGVAGFLAHPQLVERDRWRDVDTPAGRVRALCPPVVLDDGEPRMDPVPALGAHTDRVLSEIGFDGATISRWRNEGMI